MDGEPDVAGVASLLADPSRAAICLGLCGDRSVAAGELAVLAGISPQTASNHLAKLVRGRLVAVEAVGRNRFYRLAGPEVAQAIEALANIAPARRRLSGPAASDAEAFRFANSLA